MLVQELGRCEIEVSGVFREPRDLLVEAPLELAESGVELFLDKPASLLGCKTSQNSLVK